MAQHQSEHAKGAATRRRILAAAAVLMADKGPDKVSVRELTARLKITKPIIYYYFKNKNELVRAVFLEGAREFERLLGEANVRDLPFEQALAAVIAHNLELIARHPGIVKCALRCMASPSGSELDSIARESKKNTDATLDKIFKESARRGGISSSDLTLVKNLVLAVISFYILEAKETGRAEIPAGLPRRLAGIISRGLRDAKACILALFISGAATASASAGALDLTLEAAVRTALENNATVVTADETRRIYKEKIKEYWGTVYPQLSATGKYTRNIEAPSVFIGGKSIKSGLNNAYSASLDLNQVLWSGGKIGAGLRMADMYATDSDEQLKTARSSIARSVKQMYYQVLLSSALAAIQRESLDLAVQHLRTIEAQYKQGLASDLSVLRQQVEVSNTEPALTQAWNLYEEGLIELKNLLGLDPETDIALADSLACAAGEPGEIEGLYKTALMNRPEYRDAKLQRDLYREMIKVEQTAHYPYLSAFASRQFQGQSESGFPGESGRSWSTTAGLSLSLPVFSGGSTSSKVRQARLQAEIAETKVTDMERRIKIEVKKAWLGLKEALLRLKSQAASVETARKALAATEARFNNGLASQLELNDASLALNKSKTLHTQAQHDVCSAGAVLGWAAGE